MLGFLDRIGHIRIPPFWTSEEYRREFDREYGEIINLWYEIKQTIRQYSFTKDPVVQSVLPALSVVDSRIKELDPTLRRMGSQDSEDENFQN